MNRHEELLETSLKSISRIHRAMLVIVEAFSHVCEVCGGLPAGLPPQAYDDLIECQCSESKGETCH